MNGLKSKDMAEVGRYINKGFRCGVCETMCDEKVKGSERLNNWLAMMDEIEPEKPAADIREDRALGDGDGCGDDYCEIDTDIKKRVDDWPDMKLPGKE